MDYKDVLFKTRELNDEYQFVLTAWGNVKINLEKQKIMNKYRNHFKVSKFNFRKSVYYSDYPVHVLYMNTDYFIEAAKDKINRK